MGTRRSIFFPIFAMFFARNAKTGNFYNLYLKIMQKGIAISKNIVRWLLGALFVASAIMKLLSIDTFQIYVFSFNILSFAFTEIAARLLIFTELVLGLMLILKLHYRPVWWLSTLLTAGFTLFLCYVVLFRHDANCHCFGDIIEVDPLTSIFKNLFLIVLFIFIYNSGNKHLSFYKKEVGSEEAPKQKLTLGLVDSDFRPLYRKWCYAVLAVGGFVVSFVLFPPNAIYSQIFTKNDLVNVPLFDKSYADSSFYMNFSDRKYDEKADTVTFNVDTARLNVDSGRYIIAVVSAGCKYCRQSCELMSSIMQHSGLPAEQFKLLIWSANNEQCARFLRVTNTYSFETHRISPFLACDMVYGSFPTFIKIENGHVIGAFDYRGISENQIVKFLSEK